MGRNPRLIKVANCCRWIPLPAVRQRRSFAGVILGTDSGTKKTQQLLCPEYVLQGDNVVYHIRPRDEKHPALLNIGEQAQFRLEKDEMKLRPEDSTKEFEYLI